MDRGPHLQRRRQRDDDEEVDDGDGGGSRRQNLPRFHDAAMHGDDGSIIGDRFPSPRDFPGRNFHGALGQRQRRSIMESEAQAETAEHRAMELLEQRKRRCRSRRCRRRLEREEQDLLRRSQQRERAVGHVLDEQQPQNWDGEIHMRRPRHMCHFEATSSLQRREFPQLAAVARRMWHRVRQWVHHLARVEGTMVDFERIVAVLQHVHRSVHRIDRHVRPVESIPDVGPGMHQVREQAVGPLMSMLDRKIHELRQLRTEVQAARHGIHQLQRLLQRAERTMRHVQTSSDSGPTGFAVAKGQVQSRGCRGQHRLERGSTAVSLVAREAIRAFQEIEHVHFDPRKMAHFTLHRIRSEVERIERPMGHANRVVDRFSNALNMRVPLDIPMAREETVNLPWPIRRRVRVPHESVMHTYLSPRQMLSQMDRFGAMRDKVEGYAMTPMRPLLGMVQHAVQPFHRVRRLVSSDLHRIIRFGRQVMDFAHQANRIQTLLEAIDFEKISNAIQIHLDQP